MLFDIYITSVMQFIKQAVASHIPLYLLNLKIQKLVFKALFTFICIKLKKNLTLIQNLHVSKHKATPLSLYPQ